MRLLFSLLISTLFFSTLKAQAEDPSELLAGLDSIAARVLKDFNAPGCAVAVVQGDSVVFSKGYGFSDIHGKLPVSDQTVFQIGSSSKAFTAAGIGLLAEEDLVNWDEPISTYLPELKLYKDELPDQLALRDFASHRSGIPRHDFAWYLNPVSRDSLVMRMEFLEPSAAVREKWQYNNWGYLLQGVVTEKLSGMSWEDYMQKMFFKPLEMESASFEIWNLPPKADKAYGSFDNNGKMTHMDYYRIEGMGPAGSICANVRDMGKWLIPWMNEGKYKGEEVLPESYIREAISSQMVVSGRPPGTTRPELHFSNYGFGWFLSSYKGHYRVEHGGNLNGFTASVCFFPSDKIGIVVLVNQQGSQVNAVIRNTIADKMLGENPYDWHAALYNPPTEMEEEKVRKPKEEKPGPTRSLSAYTGLFGHPGYGVYKIEQKGDSLILHSKELSFWLKNQQYDVFKAVALLPGLDDGQDEGSTTVVFHSDLLGEISYAEVYGMEPSLGPLKFERVFESDDLTLEQLENYAGKYTLMGTEITIRVREDNTLMVFVPGQPEYATVPSGKHQFKLKDLDGYSVRFECKKNKPATAVNFIQPNGTFRAERK